MMTVRMADWRRIACVVVIALAMLALVVPSGVRGAEGPAVAIVLGPKAPALERLAAEALSQDLKTLFDAAPQIGTTVTPDSPATILVGSPATNPAVKAAIGEGWPKLTEQGHVLKSVRVNDRPAVVVGGGSPAATYWAVAELSHRWGLRSLMMGDMPPAQKGTLTLEGFDAVLEPTLPIRGWALMDSTPIGPAAWGIEDQKRRLRQLARQKYNRIVLDVRPWQPFFVWSYEGTAKTSDLLWPGGPIQVDGDTGGRAAFRGLATFDNPDLAGKKGDERIRAGIALLNGIVDEAHRYGMSVALSVMPFEFPKEFAAKLGDSEPLMTEPDLAVIPGSRAPLASPDVQKIALSQLRAYLDAVPKTDLLILGTTYDWEGNPEASWARLQQTGTVARTAKLEDLAKEASERKGEFNGEEGALAVRAEVAAIPATRLLVETPELKRRDGISAPIILGGIDPVLARLGLRITPAGGEVMFLQDPPSDTTRIKPSASSAHVKLTCSIDWNDYAFGLLPRFHTKQTAEILGRLREERWSGFTIYEGALSGLDSTAYFVSRASFDAAVTPESSLRELVDHVVGEGSADRVWKAIQTIEAASEKIDFKTVDPSYPDAELFQRHAVGKPVPEWWAKVRDANLEAMNEMYRANTRARDGGRAFSLYLARRFETGFETMNSLDALRQSVIAGEAGDKDKQIEQLEKAIESAYGALNAHAAVARDQSDRGAIAVMNEHGYRYLQARLKALEGK